MSSEREWRLAMSVMNNLDTMMQEILAVLGGETIEAKRFVLEEVRKLVEEEAPPKRKLVILDYAKRCNWKDYDGDECGKPTVVETGLCQQHIDQWERESGGRGS